MINEQEAQDLITKLISLKQEAQNTEDVKIKIQLKRHEQLCMQKFSYLVTMKTGRYKTFNNYEDLNQEGFEALIKAMKNYNPAKGSFFWWAHKYIDTRISRSANLHTTIRYPLKVAKTHTPHKEAIMPTLIEEVCCPDKQLEQSEVFNTANTAFDSLNPSQKEVIDLVFGFSGDKPLSINKICKKLNISRPQCLKTINVALSFMKDNIKL